MEYMGFEGCVKYPRLGYFIGQFPVSYAMWNGTFDRLQNPRIPSAWAFWDHIWKEDVILFQLVYSAVWSDHYSNSWSMFCLYSILLICHMSLSYLKSQLHKFPVLWAICGLILFQLPISWRDFTGSTSRKKKYYFIFCVCWFDSLSGGWRPHMSLPK